MKNIKFILVVVLGVFVLTGCAGTKATEKSGQLYLPEIWISPEEVTEDLQTGVSEANSECEGVNYRHAIRKYDELLSKYRSMDRRLEVALLTNKAMCYLEDGEQGGFMRTAKRLDEISADVKHLSHETQVVLEIHKKMEGVVAVSDDPRIEQRISSSVNTLFERGK